MRPYLAAFAAALLATAPLGAQQHPVGRLEGTVADPGASRSARAASVSIVRLEPEPSLTFDARPDASGRYRIDSLPAGRYLVQLASPTLDSLELALAAKEVRIAAGETARADFALPVGTAIRDAVCPGLSLGRGRAVVTGRAVDADTDRPITDGRIVVSWTEVSVDAATLKSSSEERAAAVETGPRGEYRLCGVPTGSWLSIQLQHRERAGAAVRLTVSDDEGAVVRNLSLSTRDATSIAALDSTLDSTDGPMLTGDGAVTGTVRGANGQPLANAEVRVRDARASAVTDAAGRYALGTLPTGTQVMLVRHLGYALTEIPVELRSGRSVQHDVQLTRAISLDSIRVFALRTQYPDFEFNRRAYFFGRFFTFDEIERRSASRPTDLLESLGGFAVLGHGPTAQVVSSRPALSRGCRGISVLVDGRPWGGELNDLSVKQIVGIEAYRDAAYAPSGYGVKSGCGLLSIWTKASARGAKAVTSATGASTTAASPRR